MYFINFILHFGHNLTILLNWSMLGNILKKEIWEKVTLARLVHGNLHFHCLHCFISTHLTADNKQLTSVHMTRAFQQPAWPAFKTVCFLFPKANRVCASVYVHAREKERGIRDAKTLKMVTWWLSKIITNHSWQLHRGDQGWMSCFFFSINLSRFNLQVYF